jgi:hypothetical protein
MKKCCICENFINQGLMLKDKPFCYDCASSVHSEMEFGPNTPFNEIEHSPSDETEIATEQKEYMAFFWVDNEDLFSNSVLKGVTDYDDEMIMAIQKKGYYSGQFGVAIEIYRESLGDLF